MTLRNIPSPTGTEKEKQDLIQKACSVKPGMTSDHMVSFKWESVMDESRTANVIFEYRGQTLDVDVSTNGEPVLVI